MKRFAAILLVSCLIGDPVFAQGHGAPAMGRENVHVSLFTVQAIPARIVNVLSPIRTDLKDRQRRIGQLFRTIVTAKIAGVLLEYGPLLHLPRRPRRQIYNFALLSYSSVTEWVGIPFAYSAVVAMGMAMYRIPNDGHIGFLMLSPTATMLVQILGVLTMVACLLFTPFLLTFIAASTYVLVAEISNAGLFSWDRFKTYWKAHVNHGMWWSLDRYWHDLSPRARLHVVRLLTATLYALERGIRADLYATIPLIQDLTLEDAKQTRYLPPLGGKIPWREGFKTLDLKLPPAFLAEQLISLVRLLSNEQRLGPSYIRQLTVQGRLSNSFRVVGIALVAASPHPHDWTTPLFDSPWGMVAPLVHDGGVRSDFHPLWRDVEGRTDFIQRIVKVYYPGLERQQAQLRLADSRARAVWEAEQLLRDPGIEAKVIKEEDERARFTIEAIAFQRLALAFHAAQGTAPTHIPVSLRNELALVAHEFQRAVEDFLHRYQADSVLDPVWFLEEGRALWDPSLGRRHEADWLPIQNELIKLELIRNEHPQMQIEALQLLDSYSKRVDKLLEAESQKASTPWWRFLLAGVMAAFTSAGLLQHVSPSNRYLTTAA